MTADTDTAALDYAWSVNFEKVQAAKGDVVAAMRRKVDAMGAYTRASRVLALAARAGREATKAEHAAFDDAVTGAAEAIRALDKAKAAEALAKLDFKRGVSAEQMEVARGVVRSA